MLTSSILEILKSLRPKYYYNITWVVVISGTSLASKPIWLDLLNFVLNANYKFQIIGPYDSLYGILIIILGLGYNLIALYNDNDNHPKKTSQKDYLLSKFKELEIDLGIVYEEKRGEAESQISVQHFQHNVRITSKNLHQKIDVTGVNSSAQSINYLDFKAGSVVPCRVSEMKIKAVNNLLNRELITECNDNYQSSVKNIRIFFNPPIMAGKELAFSLSYYLENTMTLVGNDYFLSTINYKKPVENYTLNISFDDNPPEKVKVFDFAHRNEYFMDGRNPFQLNLTSLECKYINRLWLICTYNRNNISGYKYED